MSPLLGTFAGASVRGYRSPGGPGQIAYTTTGTYSFKVPDGVSSVVVLAVGGGQSGGTRDGGDGGSLSYNNALSVTAGETLTVQVGAGGYASGIAINGGDSTILRGATVLLRAKGGGSASANVGSVSYTGGAGGSWGGGGAAGYSGNGGAGSTVSGGSGTAGTGGGGGGGGSGVYTPNTPNPGDYTYTASGGGGGVGLLGEGSSGAGGGGNSGGGGGSGGSSAANVTANYFGTAGGAYGGGGGSGGQILEAPDPVDNSPGGAGGSGAIRILWGGGRSYPSNAGDI